ncbi:adenylyl-sulfate kinase [Kytococcus sedentarius]
MSTCTETSITGDARLLDHLDALRMLSSMDSQRETLPLPPVPDVAEATDQGHALRILDTEGVPVARLDRLALSSDGGMRERGTTVTADVTWLSAPSSLPFHGLREWPTAPARHAVVLDGHLPEPPPAELTGLRGEDLVLVTAPLRTDDGGVDPRGADTLRRLRTATAAQILHAPAAGRDETLLTKVLDHLPGPTSTVTLRGAALEPVAGAGVILFTGLSGSGKSTLARDLRDTLVERSAAPVTLLDGDVVRHHLSKGLGFSAEDRQTNVRRIGWVATQIASHGGLTICSPIAPFEADRQAIAAMCAENGVQFVLVHVATPLEECERRDRKGLYARARAGQIPDFTGISSPYEAPPHPDLRVDTTGRTIEEVSAQVKDLLASRGLTATTFREDAS